MAVSDVSSLNPKTMIIGVCWPDVCVFRGMAGRLLPTGNERVFARIPGSCIQGTWSAETVLTILSAIRAARRITANCTRRRFRCSRVTARCGKQS